MGFFDFLKINQNPNTIAGLSFVAVDVETATPERGSVCSVGLAKVVDGVVVDSASTLVQPSAGDQFDPRNVHIHGIQPHHVRKSPRWTEALDWIVKYSEERPLIAHNKSFDQSVFNAACNISGARLPDQNWYCSMRLAQRLLPHLPSHGLVAVAEELDIKQHQHHDSKDDATVCAQIVIRLAQDNFTDLPSLWPAPPPRAYNRYQRKETIKVEPNTAADPNHPIYGQTVCFSGDLSAYTRTEAQQVLAGQSVKE